jgi:heat shock protein beta
MSKAELVDSLGTIARSGTAKFMEAIKEKAAAAGEGPGADSNLIGRFGVGFYSAFLVSDRITVTTKSNGDAGTWEWESSLGSTSYTIREAPEPLARGTRITLHLKEDCEDLTDPTKLATLVKTYSEFISFPIEVWSSSSDAKRVPDEAATAAARADWEAKKAAAEAAAAPFAESAPEAVTKTEYETNWAWKVQNDNKPIWVRSPKEVEKESYSEFFKSTFKEFMDPLAHTHFSIEGDIEFKAILFMPGMAPFDQQDWMRKSRSIKLYVRRVFISDQFDEDLMPRYLNFIKGVVDSNDLPLNVSREILQESRVVRVMRKRLLRKALDMIKEVSERPEKKDYDAFWEAFGRNLKLGIIEDSANREELAQLVQFASSSSGDGMTSLKAYVDRMKPEQKGIFYLAADSKASAVKAPFLAGLQARGLEVLYLTDPIDEVAITNLGTFAGKPLVDVTKEDLDMGEDEADKSKTEEAAREFAGLTAWLKETLNGKVESVVVSSRATGAAASPCLLVTSKFGWSANMEKIMRSQTMGDARAMEYMKGKKIMEINPSNAIIRDLKRQVDTRSAGAAAEASALLLFETAMLTSGFSVESPTDFAERIFAMMASKVGAPADGAAAAAAPASDAVTPEILGADPW